MTVSMKICYFGAYERSHPRNSVTLNAMKRQNLIVTECRSVYRIKILRYPILAYKFFQNCRSTDLIYVAAMGHYYMFLAWILAKLTGKRLVFDPLVSMYDTLVHDRQLAADGSITAKRLWYLDKIVCQLADKVILDTEVHVDYFVRTFNLEPKKFCVVPVGADESVFYPQDVAVGGDKRLIEALYVGNFIPLHGVTYILEAAKLLQDEPFKFVLVGDGQTLDQMKKKAKQLALSNVFFKARIPKERYAQMLNRADIVLGIFGESDKAKRVIPCKVYDACAVGASIVTADTPAIQYYFSDGLNIQLCRPQDGRSLAEAIRKTGLNRDERIQMGRQARALFETHFSTEQIGNALKICLSSVISSSTAH